MKSRTTVNLKPTFNAITNLSIQDFKNFIDKSLVILLMMCEEIEQLHKIQLLKAQSNRINPFKTGFNISLPCKIKLLPVKQVSGAKSIYYIVI